MRNKQQGRSEVFFSNRMRAEMADCLVDFVPISFWLRITIDGEQNNLLQIKIRLEGMSLSMTYCLVLSISEV